MDSKRQTCWSGRWRKCRSRQEIPTISSLTRGLEKAEAARNEQYENIMGKLDKLIAWQEAEQAAPKKRWDSIKDKAIWAVLAAVIAFLLGRIGL